MAFDKAAWDPSPAQFAGYAVVVSWISAYLIEFLLKESDVSGCLRSLFAGMTGSGSLQSIGSPLLLGVVAPYAVLWGLMMWDRKNMKIKRVFFTIGVAGLTALLVLGDLRLQIF